MPIPASQPTHSTPRQYAGTIHFRRQCAYLQSMGQTEWSLLQFDSSFSGVLDTAVAEATASRLQNSYSESDQAIFHGVLSDQSFDVVPFSVLFLC
jgi:hypothetical protein